MKRISLLILAVFLLAVAQAVSAGIVPTEAEYFFTEVKGTTGARRVVPIVITNSGPESITINSASFVGTNASEFSFSTAPTFPTTLAANASVTYNVVFYPPDTTNYSPPYPPSSIRSATLRVNSTDSTTPVLDVGLYGLSTNGTGGNNEPRLQMVTDILGYSINVGSTAYLVRPLPEDFTPIGAEVVAQMFEKAGAGNVTITPVMRWSLGGIINYGYYFPNGTANPALIEVNRISNNNAIGNSLNHQTLMPVTVTSNRTFDPGTQPFGLYVVTAAFTSYTQDMLNGRPTQRIRAARTFLVNQRNGSPRPNTYLVVYEDADNGDYQDFGFLISNVNPISDVTPTAVTTGFVPLNNATGVDGATNITIPFNEAVIAAGSAFTLTCGGAAQTFVLTGSGTNTLMLNPNGTLPSGSTCTLIGTASGITDPGGTPMFSNLTINFTIVDTAPPTVIAGLTPANNATGVSGTTNITIPFSEAVTAAGSAFTLTCGTTQTFTLTGSGTSTLTLDPTGTLPSGSACTVVGTASGITDGVGNALASNLTLNFTIADTVPPTVITANVSPANNATGVAGTTNITIPFSEPVTAVGSAFTLTCGTARPFTLTGSGTNTLTLNPTASLPSGSACTVVGTAAGITDLADNPLTSNFTLSFTIADTIPPTVIAGVVPANNAMGVVGTTNISIPFSEPVTAAGSAFTLTCDTAQSFTLTGSGTSILTLDPTATLPSGSACTLVGTADDIIDAAGNALASNITFNFTIADTVPPTVITANVIPANNATGIDGTTNIIIPFSEPVTAAGTAFTLTCGTNQTFALTGSGTNTLTLNPTATLASGAVCTVVGTSTGITDAADNPLANDFTLSFTIADTISPTVITAGLVPANNAADVSLNSTITIPFSENVIVGDSAFALTCGTSQPISVSGSGTSTLTLDPTSSLPSDVLCSVVITGSEIFDAANNPMIGNVTFSFTTEDVIAPTVSLTTPASGTAMPLTNNIVLSFSESVNLAAAPVTLTCPMPTNVTFATIPAVLPATGVTSLTLNPTGNLPSSVTCTITFTASQVADASDNQLSGTTVFTFITAIDPVLLNQAPALNVFSTGTPTLTWSRLKWAASYEVEIDTDPAFAAPRPTGYAAALTITTNSLTLPTALPAGTYYFRVRGKPSSGVPGAFSPAESFTIVED